MRKELICVIGMTCALLGACATKEEPKPEDKKEDYTVVSVQSDRIVYNTYEELYNAADLIVIGTFEHEAETELIREYDSNCKHAIVVDALAVNELAVSKVIKGDDVKSVAIAQRYGYDEDTKKLTMFSELGAMKEGEEYVYFLKYDERNNYYWAVGDSDGRYQVNSDGRYKGNKIYSRIEKEILNRE